MTQRKMVSQDDSRILHMVKSPNGKISAIFNKFPYRHTSINQEQFGKYLPFCSKIIEGKDQYTKGWTFYFEQKSDNGLPAWVNWLFF